MTSKCFLDFLIDKHAEQYTGLDDEMPDNCSEWIADLSVDELIAYADVYAISRAMDECKTLGDKIIKNIKV